MSGFVSGSIVASKNPSWIVGDFFGASLPYCTYQIVSAEHLSKTIMWKLTDHIDWNIFHMDVVYWVCLEPLLMVV